MQSGRTKASRIESGGRRCGLTVSRFLIGPIRLGGIRGGASIASAVVSTHVTIGWDAPNIDLSQIESYRGNIVLGPEQFEEVDDEWRAGVSEE